MTPGDLDLSRMECVCQQIYFQGIHKRPHHTTYTRNCGFACIMEAENAVFRTFDLYFDLEDGTPSQ